MTEPADGELERMLTMADDCVRFDRPIDPRNVLRDLAAAVRARLKEDEWQPIVREWHEARCETLDLPISDVRKSPDFETALRRLGSAEEALARLGRSLPKPPALHPKDRGG